MIYQLKSGRTLEISVEQYLDMTDEELEYLTATNAGETIEDPWFGSVLYKHGAEDYVPPPFHEEHSIEDLTSITDEEKLYNPDIDIESLDPD